MDGCWKRYNFRRLPGSDPACDIRHEEIDRLTPEHGADVRFGSKADIGICLRQLQHADRRLIFLLEIVLNQAGHFQIIALGARRRPWSSAQGRESR